MSEFRSIISRFKSCANSFWGYVRVLILVLVMLVTSVPLPTIVCYADEVTELEKQEAATKATISNLEKQTEATKNAISTLQGQKAATENAVTSLEGQSAQLQNTVDEYEEKLDDIHGEIKEAEASMAKVSKEIVALNDELDAAKQKEEYQYKQLRNQMRASYMNRGRDGLLSMLFESDSIRDLLNTTKYVEAVVDYNKQRLGELRELQAEIQAKKETVEAKQDEINEYQNLLDDKYEELEDLTGDVIDDLDATNSSISSAKSNLANFNAQLSALDATMKSLEAQTAAAQAELAKQVAARLAASGKREYTGGSYSASASELEWLAATIQAEADGESYNGKLAVGSVIMNRVKSSSFPNSIKGVITQSMQFASYRSGKVELFIERGPNSTCIQAAQEVLDGARVGDYLFFMTKPYADYYGIVDYTMIGNHAFFYAWNTNKSSNKGSEEAEEQPTESEEQPTESEEEITEPTETSEESDEGSDEEQEKKKKKKKKTDDENNEGEDS